MQHGCGGIRVNPSPHENDVQIRTQCRPSPIGSAPSSFDTLAGREFGSIRFVGDVPGDDPAAVILTCANCGAAMDERKCKLICACGYFLSCSDYY